MAYKYRNNHKIAIYKLIEIQIAGYPVAKKQLEEVSDLPGLAERVRAIEEAVSQFCDSPVKEEYLRLKFWGARMGHKELRRTLGVGSNKMSRWREEFLGLVGEKLGLIERK